MPAEKITAETLARRIVQSASADVDATETAAIRDEPDGVHRHRTRVRRLRGIVAVVRRISDPADTDGLRAALKEWGTVLGEARDAEVRAARADDALAAAGVDDADARRRLVGDERAAYRHRHDEVVAAHGSPASVRRIQLVREGGLHLAMTHPGAKAKKVFRELLRHETRRVDRAARRADGTLERYHALRKAARRLRYLAEAIDATSPDVFGDDLHRLARASKRVHKLLGDHRDDELLVARLAETRARAFGAQEDTAPYDTVIAAVQKRADGELDRLPRAVKKVRKASRRL